MTEDDKLEMPESDSESIAEKAIKKIKEKKARAFTTSARFLPENTGLSASGSSEDPENTGEDGGGQETEEPPGNPGSDGAGRQDPS